jgi:putative transposase
MTRLRHFDHLNTARFITFSCYRRLPLLNSQETKDIFVGHLQLFRERTGIKVFGYVVMPEHVHLVLYPPADISLGREIGKLKAYAAIDLMKVLDSLSEPVPRRCQSDGSEADVRAFWERRCYDHNCRTPETTIEKINYCHNNPVKRGLVSEPAAWPWSSYRWYQGFDALLAMDMIE